jgi:YHS domain-containing protein
LAGNEILVDLHLNNVDISLMPEVELSKEEITALSVYISTLHAAGQKIVSEEEADARCPVCFAPVSIKAAKAASLGYTFSGKEYYFECQDCLELFKQIPEPYSGR